METARIRVSHPEIVTRMRLRIVDVKADKPRIPEILVRIGKIDSAFLETVAAARQTLTLEQCHMARQMMIRSHHGLVPSHSMTMGTCPHPM